MKENGQDVTMFEEKRFLTDLGIFSGYYEPVITSRICPTLNYDCAKTYAQYKTYFVIPA